MKICDAAEFFRLDIVSVVGVTHVAPVGPLDAIALFKGTPVASGISPTFRVVADEGYSEVATCEEPVLRLVSRRLYKKLGEARLSGWSATPATLIGVDAQKASQYLVLTVTGRCGGLVETLPKAVTREFEKRPYKTYVGAFFDVLSWDGSEVFSPEDSGWIIVTKHARNSIMAFGVPAIAFTRLADVERLIVRGRTS